MFAELLNSQLVNFFKYFAKLNFKKLVAVGEFCDRLELQKSGDLPELNKAFFLGTE